MENKKVYCYNCLNYREPSICYAKENVYFVDNWLAPETKYKKQPHELNSDNNCPLHELKEDSGWD